MIGDGMLVIDTSQAVIAPVYTVDFADLDPDFPLPKEGPSLGALIEAWTLALQSRAVWYDRDQQLF